MLSSLCDQQAFALVRMAQFTAPYQYEQEHELVCKMKALLWHANFILRLVLHKASGKRLPPTLLLLKTANQQLSYRQAMDIADRMTLGLWATMAAVLWMILYWI